MKLAENLKALRAKIAQLEGNDDLIKSVDALITADSSEAVEFNDLETKKTTLETEKEDFKQSRDKAKTNLRTVFSAFGIADGTSADEGIQSVLEHKKTADSFSERAENIEKYEALAPDLDEIMSGKKEKFLEIFERNKDNENALSFIDFDPEKDADNFTKMSSAMSALERIEAIAGGSETLETLNNRKAGQKNLDEDGNEEEGGLSDDWFENV